MTDERKQLTEEHLAEMQNRRQQGDCMEARHDGQHCVCHLDADLLIAEIHRLRAEKADLLNCAHAIHTPVTSVDWCPKCGAVAVEGQWQKTVS